MESLRLTKRDGNITWYRIGKEPRDGFHRWIVSLPETRQICNCPEAAGTEFSFLLSKACEAALKTAPFVRLLRKASEERLCVMNFLRGSLNFDLRAALYQALGIKYSSTCFMSSQRHRQGGRWYVKENMYRKLEIPDGAVLLLADVVATGVTLSEGLKVILASLKKTGAKLRAMIFFTIGCAKADQILAEYHQLFAQAFSGYEGTYLVYFEGRFTLAKDSLGVPFAIAGTDLLKLGALLAPEYELSLYESVSAPLERCVIYDTGSRGFNVPAYLDDVCEYWTALLSWARRGHTLNEALEARWPQASRSNDLSSRQKRFWIDKVGQWAQTSRALEKVCQTRLKMLHKMLDKGTAGQGARH